MTEFSQQQFALFVLFSLARITTRSENAKQIFAHFRCVYFSRVFVVVEGAHSRQRTANYATMVH